MLCGWWGCVCNSLWPSDADIFVSIILGNSLALNSLWPIDATWWQGSGSTLAQVMACCLMAPSHYLNQCWLIISKVQWHPSENNFTRDTPAISHWILLENYLSKILFKSPRGQWVNRWEAIIGINADNWIFRNKLQWNWNQNTKMMSAKCQPFCSGLNIIHWAHNKHGWSWQMTFSNVFLLFKTCRFVKPSFTFIPMYLFDN